ncbi:hypothetical protein [Bacillus testis]|uniref:hypothetical protein n=1 Tax=Bacillus testis TaxID=1622072 RepID=UPI000A84EC6B|nr:hypothetical protein [Bacillus testis]
MIIDKLLSTIARMLAQSLNEKSNQIFEARKDKSSKRIKNEQNGLQRKIYKCLYLIDK